MNGSKGKRTSTRRRHVRRATVVVQVAVCSAMLIGFAALAVDVGHLYCTRAELQRTADASAMAGASELGDFTRGDPLARARSAAQDYATRNTVLGQAIVLDPGSDIVFGRAEWNSAAHKYNFTPTEVFSNAIRVRTRRTADSVNGAVPLFFANVFGQSRKDMSAQATAVLTPRDIVFVMDLSISHNYDSCLHMFRKTDVANHGPWEYLWDKPLADQHGVAQPLDNNGQLGGPLFGNMKTWGDATTGPGWDFANDSGLVYLPQGSSWSLTSNWASQTLSAKGYGSYISSEMSVINSSAKDGDAAAYQRRVLVGLGIYRWKSGKIGGQPGGNGDNVIDAGEVETMVPYPSGSSNPSTFCTKVGGSWTGFVDYVRSSSSKMNVYNPDQYIYGDPGLRYRYGLKSWLSYGLETQGSDGSSPGFRGMPAQPMRAVVDAVQECLDIIGDLDSNDLCGTAAYGTYGYSPADKPNNLSWLTDDLTTIRNQVGVLHAAMWTGSTNMAQGIDKGVDVLMNSANARPNAAKVMLLITDGRPTRRRVNPDLNFDPMWEFEPDSPPKIDTKQAAADARARGVRIYTITVGAGCEPGYMDEIAQIGGGEGFHAQGDIAAYREQLQDIFQKLGGRRPIELIQ
jgi:Flp pilus assembly protein TadG